MATYPHTNNCEDCGKFYTMRAWNHVRCPPCQKNRDRILNNLSKQRQRMRNKNLPPSRDGYAIIPMNGEWPPNCEIGRMCANHMLNDASWPEGIMLRSLSSGKVYRVEGEMSSASLDVGRDPQTVTEVKDEQDV